MKHIYRNTGCGSRECESKFKLTNGYTVPPEHIKWLPAVHAGRRVLSWRYKSNIPPSCSYVHAHYISHPTQTHHTAANSAAVHINHYQHKFTPAVFRQ